uniref:pre-mRNA-splicing factor 18-like n=1 Tax=Styela clava TaxID=7725 RepID=UPI00193A2C03|nr:pre-mRNA-splicing factor 18-like [Styela clava]
MDFAAILKGEVDRKRKLVEDKNIIAGEKKFFKRGDLAEKEREEYEKRHNIQREDPEAEKQRRLSLTDTLNNIGPDKDKLPMTLSRQEVIKRLRERNEPITLFGESDYEAFQRLRKLEIMAPEINKGQRNDFQDAMGQIEQEDLDELINKQNKDNDMKESTLQIKDDGVTIDKLLEMKQKLDEGDDDHDIEVILKTLQFLLKCWAEELNSVPAEKKRKIQVRTQFAIHRQTKGYLAPLFSFLKKKTIAPDILAYLTRIIKFVLDRDYVKANDVYLQMAIGNAPWPIGVTMVGIHARTGREKIFSQQIAHVLNDETQRKYIQGLKRLMTVCQRVFPTDPSKSVEYDATKPLAM